MFPSFLLRVSTGLIFPPVPSIPFLLPFFSLLILTFMYVFIHSLLLLFFFHMTFSQSISHFIPISPYTLLCPPILPFLHFLHHFIEHPLSCFCLLLALNAYLTYSLSSFPFHPSFLISYTQSVSVMILHFLKYIQLCLSSLFSSDLVFSFIPIFLFLFVLGFQSYFS